MSGASVAIGAGVAAAGAGVDAYAQHQALNKQDQAAAAGIMRQNLLRNQAQADVAQNIKQAQQNPQNIAKNQAAEQATYASALQKAAPVQGAALTSQPGASAKYADAVMKARGDVADYGTGLAQRTAAIDAPQITNLQTQLGLGDTATKLGALSDTSGNLNNLTEMQVKAITANPWLLAAGKTLQGAGTAYAGSGYYAGAGGGSGLGGGSASVGRAATFGS